HRARYAGGCLNGGPTRPKNVLSVGSKTDRAQHVILGDLDSLAAGLLGRRDDRDNLSIPQQPRTLLLRRTRAGLADLQRTITDKHVKRNVGSDPNQRGERGATPGALPVGVERQRRIATAICQPEEARRLRQIG